ncbi:hypothetical protein P5673_002402 [Acropora cervicornis]|uniref:Uncharacterized protein n=1 Tax=Acropora cervicornis TaxID=6130 RepID=A0AAD9VF48_ACRCE|nr:hypothetical protein P5673_002402 [Acropora cervicornis]
MGNRNGSPQTTPFSMHHRLHAGLLSGTLPAHRCNPNLMAPQNAWFRRPLSWATILTYETCQEQLEISSKSATQPQVQDHTTNVQARKCHRLLYQLYQRQKL